MAYGFVPYMKGEDPRLKISFHKSTINHTPFHVLLSVKWNLRIFVEWPAMSPDPIYLFVGGSREKPCVPNEANMTR